VASEVAGADLSGWLQNVLETTDELDYTSALEWYGLEFARTPPSTDPAGWLGAKTRTDGGRLIVDNVPRGTPAYDAGLNAGDEIVAIDDFRVLPEKFAERLQSYAPGQNVTLLVARREELKRLPITLAAEPANAWQLAPRQNATPAQRAHLEAWLR
jgi:predicted metalloprotease with PDZ domain